jgi:SGS domain
LQESGGRALSTNWEEAGSKNYKTECPPPEGVEEKKWEY